MTTNRRALSVLTVYALFLLLAPNKNAFSVEQTVITDDGREVLLNTDGSWRFLSNDRFADTKDGRRVRLKEDGSWQFVGPAKAKSIQTVKQNKSTPLDIKLDKVVVEKYQKKGKKNVRISTQTVFYLTLKLSAQSNGNVKIEKSDISLITVDDNKGKNYPVLSIEPSPTTIEPDTYTTLIVRADGSLQWWRNPKFIEITLNPGILDLKQPMTFRKGIDELMEKSVDGF